MKKIAITIMILVVVMISACNSGTKNPESSEIIGSQITGNADNKTNTNPEQNNNNNDPASANNIIDNSSATTIKGCVDTDGGLIQAKYGVVTDSLGRKFNDTCLGLRQVNEAKCNQLGYGEYSIQECKLTEVCKNGVCVLSDQKKDSCNDTDIRNVSIKGVVKDEKGTYTDNCFNSYTVTEYYCSDETGYMTSEVVICKTGEKCFDGTCAPSGEASTCTDTDSVNIYTAGYVTDPKGTFYDSCQSANSLIEYKCNSVGYMDKNYETCTNGCENGACKASTSGSDVQSSGAVSTCTDSDDGETPKVKGVVKDRVTSYNDICLSARQVREYYCNSLGYKLSKDIYCDASDECTDGACKPADPLNACSDTDGGNTPNTKGVVTDIQKEYTDYCASPTIVVEYRCSDITKHLTEQNNPCGEGLSCSDGACR